jgi:hypothetical protein
VNDRRRRCLRYEQLRFAAARDRHRPDVIDLWLGPRAWQRIEHVRIVKPLDLVVDTAGLDERPPIQRRREIACCSARSTDSDQ